MKKLHNLLLFWAFVIGYLLLVLLDGYLTYIGTPDLKNEANPLVVYLGFGWTGLFLVNAVVYIIMVYLAYYALIKYRSPVLQVSGFKQYTSMLLYNRPDKFIWTFYKLPKNWKSTWALAGYILVISMPIGRLITDLEWILTIASWKNAGLTVFENSYHSFKRGIFWGRLDILIVLVLASVAIVYWLYREYKANEAGLHLPLEQAGSEQE